MTTTPIFVCFNGPAGVGKTTLARILARMLQSQGATVVWDQLFGPAKHMVATALGSEYMWLKKDIPEALFRGYSIREVLIDLQYYFTERYGRDLWARLMLHRHSNRTPTDFVLIDDVRAPEDVDALTDVFLIEVHRAGHEWEDELYSYVGGANYILYNNGTLDDLTAHMRGLVPVLLRKAELI